MNQSSRYRVLLIAALAVFAVAMTGRAAPASAHHSYAMFDKTRTLTINGTLYAVEWKNPHSWIWVEVANPDGTSVVWGFEGGSPAVLKNMGYSKKNLLLGTKLAVTYNPLKDGRTGGGLVDVKIR